MVRSWSVSRHRMNPTPGGTETRAAGLCLASRPFQRMAPLQQYRDHDLSLTDAISFALMQQEKINEAFTLDQRFAVAGYSVLPLT